MRNALIWSVQDISPAVPNGSFVQGIYTQLQLSTLWQLDKKQALLIDLLYFWNNWLNLKMWLLQVYSNIFPSVLLKVVVRGRGWGRKGLKGAEGWEPTSIIIIRRLVQITKLTSTSSSLSNSKYDKMLKVWGFGKSVKYKFDYKYKSLSRAINQTKGLGAG